MKTSQRSSAFQELCREVAACTRCARMRHSARILGPASGRLDAPVIVIAEAPGRLGADQTHIPLHGDASGANFERLLDGAGIAREALFVTNAVLCNPRNDQGHNSPPTRAEVASCAAFLRRQLELVSARIVVTLGVQSLKALKVVSEHDFVLSRDVGKALPWYERHLIPLYHPGPRALIHRSFETQLRDYEAIASLLAIQSQPPLSAVDLAHEILLRVSEPITYFALHKLFYLIECHAVRTFGHRLTSAYIIRQRYGPYVTPLQLKRLCRRLPGLGVARRAKEVLLYLRPAAPAEHMPRQYRSFVARSMRELGHKTDSQLMRSAYFTPAMRRILLEERAAGTMLNAPLSPE